MKNGEVEDDRIRGNNRWKCRKDEKIGYEKDKRKDRRKVRKDEELIGY